MIQPLTQHQTEIELNFEFWQKKPLLRQIYTEFYQRIVSSIDFKVPGRIVEIGSGIGNLKSQVKEAISTDIFPNRWLDLVCDGYELPFRPGGLSHIILFDVFHHLEAPFAFLKEAKRALAPQGRVIIFDPYISLASSAAYGCFHHEPVAWTARINPVQSFGRPRQYYAAQGNATRLFFGSSRTTFEGWKMIERTAFASFGYLLSGGFSKPSLYPLAALPLLRRVDSVLSLAPRLFGARCLVVLAKQ